MKKHLSVTGFIFNILKPYKSFLAGFVIVALVWAINNALMPYMLKLLIDSIVKLSGDKKFTLAAIKPYVLLYAALWFVTAIDMRALDWIKLKLFPSLRQDTMNQMFKYLNQHSYSFFQNNFAGSLVNKITDMQGAIIDIINIIDDILAQTLGLLIAVISMSLIHPIFTVVLLGWVGAFLGITFLFFDSIKNLSHNFAEARSSLVGKMVDSISNIVNVRLFAKHNHENKYIANAIDHAIQKDRNMLKQIMQMRIFWDVTIVILLGFNLWLLCYMYFHNMVTIGDFTFIMTLSNSIMWGLWFVAGQFVSFSEQLGKCKQALSIMNKSHDIVDIKNAKKLQITKGCIEFKEVSFHYGNNKKLFKNKNILITSGQKVGLVGFSGSGKSTFVNLILRLFDAESGAIYIDNQNIATVTQESLRENIAFIPQDISLFHRTLMDNIRYGRVDATDNEVYLASKKAHCEEFITQLSEGYNSMVGERGIKLSGGQRQRIAIARAILKNAPILILDEATSALDSVTEKFIQESIEELMQNKTTIAIAHRLSTLIKMDRILVFDSGKIIEDGTHEELLIKNGHYAKLWQMQSGGFLTGF